MVPMIENLKPTTPILMLCGLFPVSVIGRNEDRVRYQWIPQSAMSMDRLQGLIERSAVCLSITPRVIISSDPTSHENGSFWRRFWQANEQDCLNNFVIDGSVAYYECNHEPPF